MSILLRGTDRYRLPIHDLCLQLLLIAVCIQFITSFPSGFVLALPRSHHSTCPDFQKNAVNEKIVEADTVTNDSTLVFRADYEYESETAPLVAPERMLDFFRDAKNRDCLCTAGGQKKAHTIETTDELLVKWKKRASTLGAVEPDSNDVIINVQTGRIHFPGLTVDTTSVIGSKLIGPAESTSFPNYEFVLIQDKRKVDGLRPIVWVFNRLMAPSKKEGRDTTPLSLTRVFALPSEDGKDVKFKTETFLEVQVIFPSFLLNILPTSKEKAEAQGGEAVKKVLSKDIKMAVDKFRECWVDF